MGNSSPESQDRLNSSAGTAAAHESESNLAARVPGNVWGFADMNERLAAAEKLQSTYGEAEDAVAPVQLPDLQVQFAVSDSAIKCKQSSTALSLLA